MEGVEGTAEAERKEMTLRDLKTIPHPTTVKSQLAYT